MDNLAYKEPFMEPSKESIQLAGRFRDMASSMPDPAMQKSPDSIERITLADYIKLTREYLQMQDISIENMVDEIMPESVLKERLAEIDKDSHIKAHFIEGYVCRIVPIPCTSFGTLFSADEILEGSHIRGLTIENRPDGMTTKGFSPMKTYVHKILPAQFDDCGFIVGKYDAEGLYEITQNDRARIKQQYEEAFHKAKDVLKDALQYLK